MTRTLKPADRYLFDDNAWTILLDQHGLKDSIALSAHTPEGLELKLFVTFEFDNADRILAANRDHLLTIAAHADHYRTTFNELTDALIFEGTGILPC